MRAIRVHRPGGPETLELDEVPDPTPKAGEALVEIDAAHRALEERRTTGKVLLTP
ncbi:MAG: hypothetical protein ACREQQ_08950 [Candidatus Binatia bacterium]